MRAIHERGGDTGNPGEHVADVTCSCGRIFDSAVCVTAEEARAEAVGKYSDHARQEAEEAS
jgi:hypothetical protein